MGERGEERSKAFITFLLVGISVNMIRSAGEIRGFGELTLPVATVVLR